MTHSVSSTCAMTRALISSAAIGLSIAWMLTAALAIAGAPGACAPVRDNAWAGHARRGAVGPVHLRRVATSFVFADGPGAAKALSDSNDRRAAGPLPRALAWEDMADGRRLCA